MRDFSYSFYVLKATLPLLPKLFLNNASETKFHKLTFVFADNLEKSWKKKKEEISASGGNKSYDSSN